MDGNGCSASFDGLKQHLLKTRSTHATLHNPIHCQYKGFLLDLCSDFGSEGWGFESLPMHHLKFMGLWIVKGPQAFVFPDNTWTSRAENRADGGSFQSAVELPVLTVPALHPSRISLRRMLVVPAFSD